MFTLITEEKLIPDNENKTKKYNDTLIYGDKCFIQDKKQFLEWFINLPDDLLVTNKGRFISERDYPEFLSWEVIICYDRNN